MPSPARIITSFHRYVFVLGIAVCCSTFARTQDAAQEMEASVVNVLEVTVPDRVPSRQPLGTERVQNFDLAGGLVCLRARLNGIEGDFILDTGAPSLLLNHRDRPGDHPGPVGIGAGGPVQISNAFVRSFQLSGRQYRRLWALSLDMRTMEERLDRRIDGFVGYNLFRRTELRIDYANASFEVRKPTRKPLHEGRAPDATFKLNFDGHLPVITVAQPGRKRRALRLGIDTGSNSSVLDRKMTERVRLTGGEVNMQGLDGASQICPKGVLLDGSILPSAPDSMSFVLMDLTGLSTDESHRGIDGLLGSDYLSNFTVGIDYARRRLYLWKHR